MLNTLGAENRLSDLELELEKFDPASLEEPELSSWYYYHGLAAVHAANRNEAFSRFQAGRKAVGDHPLITFSLGQEHEFRGETKEAFALFDASRYPKVPAAFALSQARYAYLWDDLNRALDYLLPLLESTYDLKNADDNNCFLNGLPFFADTWTSLTAVHILRKDITAAGKTLEEAEKRLENYDFSYLKVFYQCLKSGNFDPIVTASFKSAAQQKEGDPWAGHTRLRTAILTSQASKNLEHAAELLTEPKFAATDFPWLEDMRLLARCALARMSNFEQAEGQLRREFLIRQPGLFELHHALSFNLLAYQNTLRDDYRKTRPTR